MTDIAYYELFPNPVVVEPVAMTYGWPEYPYTVHQPQKIVAFDIDGVIVDLHTPWLARYNSDFDDELTVDKIKSWDMDLYVKPNAKKAIYDYICDPYLYDIVLPFPSALSGVNRLRGLGYRVVFKTDATLETMGRKYVWLNERGFMVDKNDYIECKDTALIRADALLDDNHTNVTRFIGYGVLLNRPWNASFSWYPRVSTLAQFVEKVTQWRQHQNN